MPKKLVLAVIDSLKPEQLDRAVAAGEAPVLAKILEDGTYVRDCVSVYPSVTPVAGRGDHHRRGPRPAPDPVDELVPPRRGAIRRVRLVVPRDPRARGLPLALRHGLQHEHGPPLAGGEDRLRAPRRRRPAHGGHHLPDLARPPPPRAQRRLHVPARGRGRPVPPPGVGPEGVLLRRPVRLPGHRLHGHARHARPARPPQRLRGRDAGREGPVRLPALLAARQRRLLAPLRPGRAGALDRRGRPRAGPAHGARRRPRGVPGGPRRDRHVGPFADPGRGAGQPGRRAVPWRLLAPADVAPDEAEVAICPAARSAMVYALDEEKREQTAADLVEDLTDVDGIDLVSRWPERRGRCALDQGRAALRPRR